MDDSIQSTSRVNPVTIETRVCSTKYSYKGRLSQRTACSEMDDPVRKTAIHHPGKFRQFNLVAVQVDAARRAVKSKIEDAVVCACMSRLRLY